MNDVTKQLAEALELAGFYENVGGAMSFATAQILRRQHQRIEALEKALREVCDCLDTYQQGEAWENAQDLLSTTQQGSQS